MVIKSGNIIHFVWFNPDLTLLYSLAVILDRFIFFVSETNFSKKIRIKPLTP